MPETKFYRNTSFRPVLRTIVSRERDLRRHPADHPRVQDILSDVSCRIHTMLEEEPSILLGVEHDTVILQNRREKPDTPVLRWIREAFEEKRLRSIVIRRGVTTRELHLTFCILAGTPERIMEGGTVHPSLEKNLEHVDLNRPNVRISMSADTNEGTDLDNRVAMAVSPRNPAESENVLKNPADLSLKAEHGQNESIDDAPAPTPSDPPSMEQKLCRAMQKLDALVNRRDVDLTFDRTGRALEQLLSRVVDADTSFDELHCALIHAVGQMESDTRRALFGRDLKQENTLNLQRLYERIPPRYRGKLLAREARETSPSFRSVPNAVRTLTLDESDLVDVLQHTTNWICAGSRVNGDDCCTDVSRLVHALKTVPETTGSGTGRTTSERGRARDLQEELLPFSPPVLSDHDVAFDWVSAAQVGGDYLDVFPVGNRKCGLLCASINERGWTAVALMSLFRCFVHSLADPDRTGVETIQKVNEILAPHLRPHLHISAVYGVLDLRDNTLSVTNAGAPRPIVIDRDMNLPQFLASKGERIGNAGGPDAFNRSLTEEELTFRPGDLFLTCSEGVVRATREDGEDFDNPPIQELLNADRPLTPECAVDHLLRSVDTVPEPAHRIHDRSALAIRRHPSEEASDV